MKVRFDSDVELTEAMLESVDAPYALITPAATILADSITELIAELINGYEQMGDDDALVARHILAQIAADCAQADLCAERNLDPSQESEDVLTALFTPRTEGRMPWSGHWTHRVPLVVVATDYAPATEVPLPTGNVQVIDPCNERGFLTALNDLGLIRFAIRVPGTATESQSAA